MNTENVVSIIITKHLGLGIGVVEVFHKTGKTTNHVAEGIDRHSVRAVDDGRVFRVRKGGRGVQARLDILRYPEC